MAGLGAYKRSYWGGGRGDWHLPLFEAVAASASAAQEGPLRVLYPGCHRHLTAALAFANVLFVDCDRKVADTFASAESHRFVEEFLGAPRHRWSFACANYEGPMPGAGEHCFDLLLSLSAGVVSRPCTAYVRPGGFLLASDAHSDARTAFLMPEWELVAVWDAEAKELLSDRRVLHRCFRVKGTGQPISASQVEESQRVGSKAKRSFTLELEPMFFLFQKRAAPAAAGGAVRTSASSARAPVAPPAPLPPPRRSKRLQAKQRPPPRTQLQYTHA